MLSIDGDVRWKAFGNNVEMDMTTAIFVIVSLIALSAAGVLFINNAHRFTFVVLSRPFTIILMILLWMSLPDYNKEWIDSYEDRNGYHDVYETTFTGDPSRFEDLFDGNSAVAYFIFNSSVVLFLLYSFVLLKRITKPLNILAIEIDAVGMLVFSGLFLFNPFDPLIDYLPPNWILGIKTSYLISFGAWVIFYGEARRLFKDCKMAT